MGEAKRRKLAAQRSQIVSPPFALAPSGAVAALVLAALSMGVSKPALAQMCSGPLNNFVCTPETYTSNINLNGNFSDTLNLTLKPGVVVNSPGGGAVKRPTEASPREALQRR